MVSTVMGKGFPIEKIPWEQVPQVLIFATGTGIAPIKALIESPSFQVCVISSTIIFCLNIRSRNENLYDCIMVSEMKQIALFLQNFNNGRITSLHWTSLLCIPKKLENTFKMLSRNWIQISTRLRSVWFYVDNVKCVRRLLNSSKIVELVKIAFCWISNPSLSSSFAVVHYHKHWLNWSSTTQLTADKLTRIHVGAMYVSFSLSD